ncbi:kelch repeat-containing protein [Sorangium sp. So ce260]|uniref:hypothetical protein n=1 Tax=Sorangium sp. So ce260 TaxID=3133291 RepID=UPI003F61528F
MLALLALAGCSTQPQTARDDVDSLTLALDPTPAGTWKIRDWGDASFDDHARFVYHAGMEKVLLVSGRPNRGVFSWDGRDWNHVADANSNLFMQGAAYDEAHDRVVVFGGLVADHVGAGNSRSTWFFSDGAWQEQMPNGPAAGGGATLAYDAARDRIVLTGGASHTNGTLRQDTWLFDGEAWTKADAAESPASQYAGAAYDRARELVVLVRPVDGTASETWEWNGTAWRRIAATTPLPYEYSYSLAYDDAGGRVVGLVEGGLWAWDGSAWSRVDASDGQESERARAVIAHDAARGRLVARNASASTWEYDGVTWHKLPSTRPRARNSAAHVYDSARGRVIYFGSVTDPEDATWEWDGAGWTRGPRAMSSTPTGLAMAYDSRRARAVTEVDKQTWEYDGTAWVDVGPAPSTMSLMAFDAARGVTVALSGTATWTWDGASWQQVMVDGPTSARDSAMTYDASRERVVRFGGYTDGTGDSQIDETWEWDGSTWTLMSPATRPTPRGGHSMAFDERRGLVVLYGGYRHNEVWEYDGTTWVQRVTPTAPPGSFSNGMVYDAASDRMVFFANDGTLWEFLPVGDACTSGDECPSGACVSGICCDRACTSSCEACSVETGATRNGICEVLPDAGADCTSSEVDAGPSDGGPTSRGKSGGGCSVAQGAPRTSGEQAWPGWLALAAAVLRWRRRAPE